MFIVLLNTFANVVKLLTSSSLIIERMIVTMEEDTHSCTYIIIAVYDTIKYIVYLHTLITSSVQQCIHYSNGITKKV